MYDEVKRDIRIGDVLSRYGIPHPDRISYRIPCPIHHGRDSNFSVSEREGLWNCFSVCGAGGSVIDLVAALDDIDPKEAVRKLAKDFNIAQSALDLIAARDYQSKFQRFDSVRKSMDTDRMEALESYPRTSELEEGYRGLRAGTIKHWGLARTDDGIFIPDYDSKGRICSYAIRRDDGNPKYQNLRGVSKCYPFGLSLNSGDIIKEGFAWVVEGQFDAISLWQKGYRNVIALQGSSMTEQQAMLILAVTSNLMLCMDGDSAGRLAAARIKKQWQNVFDIGIFYLPEGVDPDEFEGILEKKIWHGSPQG